MSPLDIAPEHFPAKPALGLDPRACPRLDRGVDTGLADTAPQRLKGLAWLATSLTRSAWRMVPVFANKWCRWVLTVASEIPSARATAGTPPISTTAWSTRTSLAVRP